MVTTETAAKLPVVALHSSASTGGQWKSLAAALQGRTVCTPDLPGYGRAAFRDSARDDAASLGGDAAAVLRTLGGANGVGAFHLVGHSYGGAVAMKIALAQPQRVASLTLIEPVLFHLLLLAGSDEDMRLYRGILGVRDRLRGAVAAGWPAHGMAAFVDFWNGQGSWDRAEAEQRQRLAAQARAVLRNFTACFGESWPVWELRRLSVPLLAISGTASPDVGRRLVDKLVDVAPDVTSARLFGAGHMAPITHAAAVNALIERHVRLAEGAMLPTAGGATFRRASVAA
ncbi:MAG TPA: alpha/beta fold hydrolase [Kiloniellaceae bacterium]|nr:alpha/beta fold hydrolase [Kiloniellaceae bacterium]